MPYYRQVGELPPKRHTQFRQPDGSLYAEELMGEEGFTSDSSLLYHRYPPTAILKSEGVDVDGVVRLYGAADTGTDTGTDSGVGTGGEAGSGSRSGTEGRDRGGLVPNR